MAAVKSKDPYAAMMDIMVSAAADSGTMAVPYSDPSKTLEVVAVPTIALQWLINSNGWPLGRMTSSAGEPKTFKSTFGYQLMQWFIMAGGMANVIDTETKAAADTLRDMIDATGIDPEILRQRCTLTVATTNEQWQSIVLKQSADIMKTYATPKECLIPSITILDTLTGANCKAGTDELVENEGGVAMSRVGQQNAKSLYQFFRDSGRRLTCGGMSERWPSVFHYVNQEQARQDGFAGRVRAGGVSQDYYTSLDLTFKKGGTSAYNKAKANKPGAGKEGRIITMGVRFSAIGPDGPDQTISVPVIVNYSTDEDGMKHREVAYDWGAADTHFLSQHYNKIKKVFDMETKYVQGHGMFAKSSTLGVDDFIRATEFGLKLQNTPEVMALLQNELCIAIHPIREFAPPSQ